MTIDELKDRVARLNGLLQDPQPGLFSWHMAVHDLLKEITEMYNGIPKEG